MKILSRTVRNVLWVSKCAFALLIFFSLPQFGYSQQEETVADTPEAVHQFEDSVVQILAYRDDQHINQGSGVAIAEGGIILTGSHLLASANKYIVQIGSEDSFEALLMAQDEQNDLAILRIDNDDLVPVTLSSRNTLLDDTVDIFGYWNNSLEQSRRSFFGISNRPKFVPEIHQAISDTKGLYSDTTSDGENMIIVTTVGRGAYGAPVANRCGQLAGLVRSGLEMSIDDLWEVHLPVGAIAVNISLVNDFLADNDITPPVAKSPCLTAAEERELQAAEAEEQLEEERAARKSAEDEAAEAREEAEQEKEQREQAEDKSEDLVSITEDTTNKVAALNSSLDEAEAKQNYLVWAAVGVGVLGVFIILMLGLKRKKDLLKAEKAIEEASASFGDCRFSGTDSKGNPLAFTVLGKDLMQRDGGLLVGRNPEMVQVVIADETVSRVHASLKVEEGYLQIDDMGSTGGSRVNSVTAQRTPVISGDLVEFGEVRLKLEIS